MRGRLFYGSLSPFARSGLKKKKGEKKGVDDTHGVNNSKSTTLLFFLCCSSSVVRLLLLLLFSLFFVREMTVCVFFSPAFVSLLVFSLSVFFFFSLDQILSLSDCVKQTSFFWDYPFDVPRLFRSPLFFFSVVRLLDVASTPKVTCLWF